MNKDQLIKVSVIVPVHNAENTIERCIESLLNQSLEEIEIILINDHSTDNTNSILNAYHQLYPNKIHLLQSDKPREMCGPGYARNMGIQTAQGTFMSFVDSDDWIDSNLYYSVYENAVKVNADIAIFGVKDELLNSMCATIRYQYQHLNVVNHKYALHMLCHTFNNDYFISPMACQKIYKTNFIRQNNLYFDTDSFYEDDQFTFCCFLHNCRIIMIPDVYYHYNQNPSSITHNFSKKHIDTLVKTFINIRKYLQNYDCYNEYQNAYHSYFDKCLSSTLNMLFRAEPTVKIQKKYIIYLFNKLNENFPIEEWIAYLDVQRVKRFFYITE
ncbi:MAG: glycosyltransferase family 2 protein [Erysipelotrichales bacterium]|nr:glycosyltransferase family 2 protein [Erysipelotrichales bacterium]